MNRILLATLAVVFASSGSVVRAEDSPPMGMMSPSMMKMGGLTIDAPVVLKEAKVVFRIDRVASNVDNSFVLQQIGILWEKFRQMETDAKIAAVFNGDGGFMLLNDMTYNEVRKTKDGNPYKAAIASLLAKGITVEECGMTMMREGWSNKQLLPGIRVNSGANLRVIELAQNNFVVLGQ